jgi:phage terminase Nu1 subunit (DNA packaging protein)
MADAVDLSVVQVRAGDRWQAVAVIDGRGYPDRASFEAAVEGAFEALEQARIPAQVVTREVSPTEPPSRLPSWDGYHAMLATKGDRGTA